MKKIVSLTTLIAAVGFVVAASAADMPVKAPMVAPVAPYNWTGLYAGIAGGYAWGGSSILRSDGLATSTMSGNGGIFGGTLGYNWQSASWVFGLEGDASWAHINASASNAAVFPVCTAGGIGACGTTLQALATARGRLGYLVTPSILLYGTGGAAFGKLDVNVTVLGTSTDAAQWRTGWTAGGGVEAALWGNWTGKIEYLHSDLGNGPTTPVLAGLTWASQSWKTDMVRFGLNYKFGNLLRP